MNFLNTLRGPKLEVVPGEFHNEFIKEIIMYTCESPFIAGHLIPSLTDDVMEQLSGRYALAAALGISKDDPSFFHNYLTSNGINKNTVGFEEYVRDQLLNFRKLDMAAYERLLTWITLDTKNVLNYYHIFYREHIQTILPVGSLDHLDHEIRVDRMVNCPLVTVW